MIKGLTSAQVAERITRGQVNSTQTKSTSVASIIRKHTLTLFNLINLILAGLIFWVGSYKNALFFFVAIINTGIGIFNDVRAKKIVDKLSLVSAKKQTVIRDGEELKVNNEQIVLGDVVKYSLGSQVVVDSQILEGQAEVNESFITGESDNIGKNKGDKLISGSFVVAGTCYAEVVAVGADNFTSSVLKGAKTIKSAPSKLLSTLNQIIKLISIILIPIGILLLIKQFSISDDNARAVTSTVGTLISMIPEGLILLTSTVLALSTIRLSKRQVLVQDLYAIETLARVDTICLDKTGTITTGEMSVADTIALGKHTTDELENILSILSSNLEDNNATFQALRHKYGTKSNVKADELIPFSSDRKYSGVKVKNTTYLIGALEYLSKNSVSQQNKTTNHSNRHVAIALKTKNDSSKHVAIDPKTFETYQTQADELAHDNRVLTVLKRSSNKNDIIGFVLLKDVIRKDASAIIKFFTDNDVAAKIISGDNALTISGIATRVGFKNPQAIDLSTLKNPDFDKLVKKYNIFARVKPEQKKQLILAFQKSGHTVAMTGDGVNDVLAMKEADCSISIGEGTDAARQVSKLVLLGSNFSSIPNIIGEGRRSINNLERSATLFLGKTCYATLLAIIFIFVNFQPPFSPITMTFLNFFTIGAPAFILALETNNQRVRDHFVRNIIHYSIPTGLAVTLAIVAATVLSWLCGFSYEQTATMAVIVIFAIGLALIARISRPWNKLRIALMIGLVIIMTAAFCVPLVRNFFSITLLTEIQPILATAGLVVGALIIFFLLSRITQILINKFGRKFAI